MSLLTWELSINHSLFEVEKYTYFSYCYIYRHNTIISIYFPAYYRAGNRNHLSAAPVPADGLSVYSCLFLAELGKKMQESYLEDSASTFYSPVRRKDIFEQLLSSPRDSFKAACKTAHTDAQP